MKKEFHSGNRERLYKDMKNNSLLVLFSGEEIKKTADEFYPFFTNRNFLYLTGINTKDAVLIARKDGEGSVTESMYILPPDWFMERWTGERIKPDQVAEQSGIEHIAYVENFLEDFHRFVLSGNYENIYLDVYKHEPKDIDLPAHKFLKYTVTNYPYLRVENANILIRKLRTIKQPCEIEALRVCEEYTKEGILRMMQNSKPGKYEYQYKADWDYALGQHGPQGSGFPSIISAGNNNFCIHYYSYKGQAQDGDMILNDVGATYDGMINDVSRGWPCNGKFTDKQRLLYECALATSNHMFDIIKPGMKMMDVDKTIKEYNFERLKDAGVLSDYKDIGTYMWHGGAHHIGYDTHDAIKVPERLSEGMVFCIDVGIYHEEWGIGFRVEDNCLVTADGCENLSKDIPRTIADIEDIMN